MLRPVVAATNRVISGIASGLGIGRGRPVGSQDTDGPRHRGRTPKCPSEGRSSTRRNMRHWWRKAKVSRLRELVADKWEFFRPGMDRIQDKSSLFARLSKAGVDIMMTGREQDPQTLKRGKRAASDGYLSSHRTCRHRMKIEAGLRRWRMFSLRYPKERGLVERWLHMISRSLDKQPAAVAAIVQTATMIEGYGDDYRQGLADWNAIIDGVAKPVPDLAAAITEACAAILLDPRQAALKRARSRDQGAGDGRVRRKRRKSR